MKAKKKPLESLKLEDVGVSLDDQRVKLSNFRLPPEKPEGKKFDAMEESSQTDVVTNVVNLLKNGRLLKNFYFFRCYISNYSYS